MELKRFILATAGHVDHGKSALVRALTGTDPDRLPEEKLRGITIELGFAQLELHTSEAMLSVGIVDVPGHEDFVKNMVAGVGSINLALLVVASDDGWMPQTEEHLQILIYLGVRRIVIALTKVDLVESANAAEESVRAQLRDTPFADAAIVRTSITTLSGIEQLKAQLAREFSALVPRRDIGKPRLAVDRAFTLHGIGTVVTGTLAGGTLRRGQAVVVQPAKIPARIRAIQNHNREVEEIGPGARTALSLPDVAVARERNASGVWRGDVITLAQFGEASAIVDVMISRSSRLPAKTRPLKHGAVVRVHHGSGNFSARLFFQSEQELAAGDSAVAELRFDSPIFAFVGDQFVVRNASGQQTVAGGIVLDAEAVAKNFRSPMQKLFLQTRAQAGLELRALVKTQLARDHAVSCSRLLVKSCFGADEIFAALVSLAADRKIFRSGDFAADAEWWNQERMKAFAAIDAKHKTDPHHTGLELAQLRNLFAKETPEIFDALVADLCEQGAVRIGDLIKSAAHQPTLPPQLQMAAAKIRSALAAKPFDPPSRKEVAPDALSQEALRFLLKTGEAIDVSEEVILDVDAFQKMRAAVFEFIRHHGPAAVGQLRQALGSSRRVVVPFLERLDSDGVTRRQGDKRTLAHEIFATPQVGTSAATRVARKSGESSESGTE